MQVRDASVLSAVLDLSNVMQRGRELRHQVQVLSERAAYCDTFSDPSLLKTKLDGFSGRECAYLFFEAFLLARCEQIRDHRHWYLLIPYAAGILLNTFVVFQVFNKLWSVKLHSCPLNYIDLNFCRYISLENHSG